MLTRSDIFKYVEAHWISAILQRTEANEVYHLIAQSYDLTKK